MGCRKYREIQRVQLVIILLNVFVAAAKLALGFITSSVAMTADGFHSMTDGLNNVIGMVGVYFAFQPCDDKHPYGHRKFETMTSLVISGLLIALVFNILKGAYERLLSPVMPEVNAASFIVMLVTIIVNIIVTRYEKKRGHELGSDFLISDATHTLSDVFVSLSVIATLFAIELGFLWVDSLVSVVIAFLIGRAAWEIIRNCSDILCDAMVLSPVRVAEVVCSFKEVCSCHNIRSRGRSDDIHIDLHVIARQDMKLEDVHHLSHDIGSSIRASFPGVTDVSIHMEPQNSEDD